MKKRETGRIPQLFLAISAISAVVAFGLIPSPRADGPAPAPSASPLPPPEVRLERAREAEEKFRQLNFYAGHGGMHLPPNILKLSEDIAIPPVLRIEAREYAHRWGLNWNETEKKPEGLFEIQDGKYSVGALGCVACHSGRVAGRYFVGVGNKNIDEFQIGKDAYFAERIWRASHPGKKDDLYKEIETSAIDFAHTLSDPKLGGLTQGMVPTAVIRKWFYRVENQPMPAEAHRSAVKVPALFGYGEKRNVGQFCDGFGNGTHPGWGIAVELVANQKVDVVRSYLPRVEAAEELLGDLLPPKYPFAIDNVRAERGKTKFEQTCAHCHGTYETDSGGLPIYVAPKYIPWEYVRTDRDRIDGNTEEFKELVRRNPLNDVIQYNEDKGDGYFAPRLHAAWARFPYLHNGSVPTIAALLTPPSQRPTVFSLRNAGEANRFDAATLGLTMPKPGSRKEKALERSGKDGDRSVYWTGRVGQSNEGHDFYTDLPDSDKSDLIEYLKTL
jgi:mono/diheme cytochrome c family protein